MALAAGLLVIVTPWVIRNAVVFHGAFVPVSTQDGITAAGTYNAEAAAAGPLHALWRPPYFVRAFQPLFRDSIDEARMDTILRGDAVDYATAHPGYLFAATVLNSLRSLDIGPAHSVASRAWYYEMGTPRGVQFLVSATADLMIAIGKSSRCLTARAKVNSGPNELSGVSGTQPLESSSP